MPHLGRAIADLDEGLAASEDWSCEPPVRPQPPEPAGSRSRLIAVGTTAAFLVGVALGWLASAMAGPDGSTTIMEPQQMRPEVAATAEQFIRLYLGGDADDDLAPLFPGEAPRPSGAWVESTAAIAANARPDGLWDVTVAVALLEPVDGEFVAAPLAYFTVPVTTSGNRAAAAGPPARVPPLPPTTLRPARLTDVSAEEANTAIAFLDHYLTGDAEAARYLAATSDVALFTTAPYAEVAATVAGADAQGRVVVEVMASSPHGVTHALAYHVSLTNNEGVWEVLGVGTAA